MKLVVQIPCFNEENTLRQTCSTSPALWKGWMRLRFWSLTMGARTGPWRSPRVWVDHVVLNICNKGLARTFHAGLDACLRLGRISSSYGWG